MSSKRVGWCRINQELVLDNAILNNPYVRDDMDVYVYYDNRWLHWTPENQGYNYVHIADIPDVVKVAMMMLS